MEWIVLLFLKTKRVINEQVMQQKGKRALVPPFWNTLLNFLLLKNTKIWYLVSLFLLD